MAIGNVLSTEVQQAIVTFNKSDFVTFKKMDTSVQTADGKSALQILGYGTVFVKHTILISKKEGEVMTKTAGVLCSWNGLLIA